MTSSIPIQSKNSDTPDPRPQPLIHPASALILIVIDSLWTLADWAAFAWAVTIPLSFLAVALPVFSIQRFIRKDTTRKAAGVAALCGALAAVPTPVMGTLAGAIALGLAGLRSFPWNR